MASFQYKAVTTTGQIVTSVLDAPSQAAASKELYQKGYRPISLKAVSGKEAKTAAGASSEGQMQLFAKKVKADEIIMFTRQLVTLLRAGVPMLTALEALRDQSGKTFADVINKIYVDVMSGKSFSQALDQHPKVFSKLYVNSVKAGEMSGSLDIVLDRMGQLIKHDTETKKKVKSAMQYPMFVSVAMILAFVVIMTKVVPNFAKLFEGLHIALPLPTRIMMGVSKFMQNNVLYIFVFLVAGGLAFKGYVSKPAGRFWWTDSK